MNWTTQALVLEGATKCVNVVRISLASYWLLPSEWAIFSRIIWLCAHGALSKQRLTRSCFRSRLYFRGAFGLNVSTISSITGKLVELGFISKLQRRPIHEDFQCNMYKLDGVIWEKVKAKILEMFNNIKRVASRQHIVSKSNMSQSLETRKSDFSHKLKGPPDENEPWSTLFERRPELA